MEQKPVILFDGVCNLCNAAVNFVIRRDRHKRFLFAALQSEAGLRLRENLSLPPEINTIILVSGNRAYTRSGAALRIARKLPLPYSILYGFIIVPPFIRNFVYNYVASNRYKWFGKKVSCMVPGPDISERFLV